LLKKILNIALEKANCIPSRTVDALNKLLVGGRIFLSMELNVLYFDQLIVMFKNIFIVAKKTE